jgi:LmbE family N-acetylglucosaminyl deacetylase
MRKTAALLLALVTAAADSTSSQVAHTGAVAAWEKLLKLRTTVSVMHITAHPDDEQGGVLAKLSRGDGARVTLLTLNRGEAGDNAIGAELFDALGLIRTEELVAANRYYGVDQQYFTTAADYGFSKSLEEALQKWDRQTLLRDVVRIVRMERPTILISRFQGNERDGHGQHQAAAAMAMAAFQYAGNATMFPEQLAQGLRPWTPKKLLLGGQRESDDWSVRIDTGEFNPVLGDSYENIARRGLSFQRSQHGGRFTPVTGQNWVYYRRGDLSTATSPREASIYDGLDTSIEAAVGRTGRPIDEAVAKAIAAFSMTDPSMSVPALAEGLKLTREAILATNDPDARPVLAIKEQQFQDAINVALGARLSATTNPVTMTAPVPGQSFTVEARVAMHGGGASPAAITLVGNPGWQVSETKPGSFRVTLAPNVALSTKPHFFRDGLQDSRYLLRDAKHFGLPVMPPPLVAVARYSVAGVPVELRVPVTREESKAPYGTAVRTVRTVPRIAITTLPANAVVPIASAGSVELEVSLVHNADTPSNGQVTLRLPDGWSSKPGSQAFAFTRPGERSAFTFTVRPGAIDARTYEIDAVAIDGLGEYREGYEVIDHRDLEVQYLYRDATTVVRGINVTTVAGLKVGYVMGLGDTVPAHLQQLGAQVTLLGERDLAANLSQFDTVIAGTRAYAVREDLKTYNTRLLDYVRAGGNMVVLYNTQEFVPNTFAPFAGELPRTAEEVSEEDSPVTFLARDHQVLNWPNSITPQDFEGWVEQRGSKFFAQWDLAYTPIISTNDRNQPPQSGGWLTARVGKGTWTYFAYALHRQLPYGVPGAYRIAANLLALNKTPR